MTTIHSRIRTIHLRLVEKIKACSTKKQQSAKKQQAYRVNLRKYGRFLHLANNFLRGTSYKRVEASTSDENILDSKDCRKIFLIVDEYFPTMFTVEEVEGWVNESGD